MSIAFVILMPLGVLFVRTLSFSGTVLLHACCQLFSFFLVLAGLGLGIKLGGMKHKVSSFPSNEFLRLF
jgi:hypothetical protein